ncbi:MAG: peptide-methionine (S)-S-oxide reductase, partial [Ferruginibacter sp.]|nr:peptide-methionine (S)-S-oxide reductase [Ferruginibacter sp.]
MKSLLFTFASLMLFISCAQTQTNKLKIPVGSKKAAANEAVATFAEGCFWHAEIVFQSLVGVRDAVSG